MCIFINGINHNRNCTKLVIICDLHSVLCFILTYILMFWQFYLSKDLTISRCAYLRFSMMDLRVATTCWWWRLASRNLIFVLCVISLFVLFDCLYSNTVWRTVENGTPTICETCLREHSCTICKWIMSIRFWCDNVSCTLLPSILSPFLYDCLF